jgi:hypothetical protein
MIPAVQQEILHRLEEICDLSDDIRFGQMVDFLGFLGQDATDRNLAQIEDEQLLEVLDGHKANLLRRRDTAAGLRA